ncbi:C-type lectin [Frankliniella occidentalis]|nr:C-type lectin [Frankliniella occidentalis]
MLRPVFSLALVACVATLAAAQSPLQPAGRILEPPVPSLCAQRKIHEKFNGKGYYFSWKDASTANTEMDWLGVRNWCRQRCMDSVSIETSVENEYLKSHLVNDKVKYIWTSGRLCDFKSCEERPDLKPLNINGWFWTAELKKLAPTTDRPDNRELIQGGAPENCLAILNQFYNDGVHWHDVACHHKKPWVCEESESLINYVRFTNPNIGV